MNRAAGMAFLLTILAPGLASAGDEPARKPPAPLPVSEAAWDARDAEGRWVLYRAAGPKPGSIDDPWIPFLARRKEYAFLEWIALTSAAPSVADALALADAPGWVRCMVWSLSTNDSHYNSAGEAWLFEKKPGVALAWFERFPEAATSPGAKRVLEALRERNPARGDASSLLPPFLPETVFADLQPPAELGEWGDRTHAEPGRRYVHQVERAIDAYAYTLLEGEPWSGRLAALLSHPHPKVRRAAALAYGRRRGKEIPLQRLFERMDDPKETPEVRAAAVLGASYSEHPSLYARFVGIARDAASPLWSAAVSRIGDLDDGFLIEGLEAFGTEDTPASKKAFARETAARIRARVAATDGSSFARDVPRMLERAAWVDLGRHPLEGTLVPWTLKTVRARLGDADVRKAVENVRDAYEAEFPPLEPEGSELPAIRKRARGYAEDLLAGGDRPLGPR